jgi:hypothetical protein
MRANFTGDGALCACLARMLLGYLQFWGFSHVLFFAFPFPNKLTFNFMCLLQILDSSPMRTVGLNLNQHRSPYKSGRPKVKW